MALSRKRHLQLIIAILLGTALLCTAIAIGFAMTRNTSSSQQKATASASSSTSKTQPSQTVSPSSDPTTTSTTPTPSPTPTREPVDCTKENCVALTFDDVRDLKLLNFWIFWLKKKFLPLSCWLVER